MSGIVPNPISIMLGQACSIGLVMYLFTHRVEFEGGLYPSAIC